MRTRRVVLWSVVGKVEHITCRSTPLFTLTSRDYRDAYRHRQKTYIVLLSLGRIGIAWIGKLAKGKENQPPRGMAPAAKNATPGRRKKTGQQYFDVGKVGRYVMIDKRKS